MLRTEESLLMQCSELLNTIREAPENKKCFDCVDATSPRYVCTNFSTFVCSCCANIHKEFGHTIKCMSVFACNLNEVLQLKATGNKIAADKWLARWTPSEFPEPDSTSPTYKSDAREYFKLKYIERRWTKVIPPIPANNNSSSEGTRGVSLSSPEDWRLHEEIACRNGRAQTYPTPPYVYHYVPTHQGGMYAVPMSLAPNVDRFAYSRYPPPLDLNQVYYHPAVPPLPPARPRSFQFDGSPFREAVAMYGSPNPFDVAPSRPEVLLRSQTDSHLDWKPNNNFINNNMEESTASPIIRSASAHSVMLQCTHDLSKGVDSSTCATCTKIFEREAKEKEMNEKEETRSKWKVNTLVSKMAGFLGKKGSPPAQRVLQ